MIPENTGQESAVYSVYPDRTYHIDLKQKRIYGYCDGVEAIRQAVYKILAVIRFEEIIYSDNYGSRLIDCMDRLKPYAWAEIERTITQALLYDDRITAVEDFQFAEDKGNKVLNVSFTVKTVKGDFTYTKEVMGYV